MVHRTGGRQHSVRIESQAYNLLTMSLERVHHLASNTVPNLRRLVEATSHNEITEGVVKGHRADDVLVLFETEQFAATLGVPDLASPIVASRDKLIARLVEGAIRQRQ